MDVDRLDALLHAGVKRSVIAREPASHPPRFRATTSTRSPGAAVTAFTFRLARDPGLSRPGTFSWRLLQALRLIKGTAPSHEETSSFGRCRTASTHLKARLLALGLKEPSCEACGIATWRDRPLSLALHHVNGIRDDNRLIISGRPRQRRCVGALRH